MSEQQPSLHLLRGDEITLDNILRMFRDLTGRDPTPEELAEAKAEWERKDDGTGDVEAAGDAPE